MYHAPSHSNQPHQLDMYHAPSHSNQPHQLDMYHAAVSLKSTIALDSYLQFGLDAVLITTVITNYILVVQFSN